MRARWRVAVEGCGWQACGLGWKVRGGELRVAGRGERVVVYLSEMGDGDGAAALSVKHPEGAQNVLLAIRVLNRPTFIL